MAIQENESLKLHHIKLCFIKENVQNTHNNFNCTLGNLGWDGQSLEEGSLLRSKTSVLGLNVNRAWSQCTSTSWGTDPVFSQAITDINQIIFSEDESYIAPDVREKPKLYKIVNKFSKL